MTELMKLIIEKIGRTDIINNVGSQDKIREGEKVEHTIECEEIKKLFAISERAIKLFTNALSETRFLTSIIREQNPDPYNDPRFLEAEKGVARQGVIASTYHKLLWNSITFTYPDLYDKSCAIREGWKIVSNVQEFKIGKTNFPVKIPLDLAEETIRKVQASPDRKKPSTLH